MAYDADVVELDALRKQVEILCPRCKYVNGGIDWPKAA